MTTLNYTFNENNNTNYSEILDNIILDTVTKKNSYLKDTIKKEKDNALIDALIKDAKWFNMFEINSNLKNAPNELTDAINSLAALHDLKKKNVFFNDGKYKLNTTYYICGTPIVFYDDSIQIDDEYFFYDDFNDNSFITKLNPKVKNTIVNINIKL